MARSKSLLPMVSIKRFVSLPHLTFHPISVMAVNIKKYDQPTISFKPSKEYTRIMQPDSSSLHLMPSTDLGSKANAMKSDLPTFNFKPCSEMADTGPLQSPLASIKSCSLKAGRMTALTADTLKP